MEQMGVFPPSNVVNVGDTIPDVASGRNAGTWSVGVVMTGNMIGLDEDEIRVLDPVELESRARQGRERMKEAGAHFVIDGVEQLPELLDSLNKKIALGGKP
jgi:phosphonoacetaldehyde hydrolase